MKKILFVINTLGRAGAETALVNMLRAIDKEKYDISLFVLAGQGELIDEVPDYVKVLNKRYYKCSVHSREGKRYLLKTVLSSMNRNVSILKNLAYIMGNLFDMLKKRNVLIEKLLWRVISDGAYIPHEKYDLAVAFLEGGSSYYVAEHINAVKKAAFVHVDYVKAGYSRRLDKYTYSHFDKIYAVSNEVKNVFMQVYPEHAGKLEVFHNIIDREGILNKAGMGSGFTDDFDGIRLLSVGRLTTQKALNVSVDAMKLLISSGERVRWYVLGEGDQRKKLEEQIERLGMKNDFLLLGAVDNPYVFMSQADIYVHASRFEGKSIAIQEAQVLGMSMVISDCSGNREQVVQGVDGILCNLDAESIAEAVKDLIHDKEKRESLGRQAALKNKDGDSNINILLSLID